MEDFTGIKRKVLCDIAKHPECGSTDALTALYVVDKCVASERWELEFITVSFEEIEKHYVQELFHVEAWEAENSLRKLQKLGIIQIEKWVASGRSTLCMNAAHVVIRPARLTRVERN